MLSFDPPNVKEMRAILKDIVADEQRASDVILGLRRLLRQEELSMETFDMVGAIEEVIMLVGSEAIIRNATIDLDAGDGHLFVKGDRVQLQQVILTLLQNAMEAMNDVLDRERVIVICCGLEAERLARVGVRDSGCGFPPDTEERLFEPFFTTKSEGMGMGLSIARSIVEAHGGTIRALNLEGGGAIFEFYLPADGTGRA
jgi:two-component system sensor kinase FixL